MPIPTDEFERIDGSQDSLPDLSADTTQGRVYRFLLRYPEQAFRQREIIDGADVPRGSVGPTLNRLEEYDLVEHRGDYWAIAASEQAGVIGASLSMAAADSVDDGFDDEDRDRWLEQADSAGGD